MSRRGLLFPALLLAAYPASVCAQRLTVREQEVRVANFRHLRDLAAAAAQRANKAVTDTAQTDTAIAGPLRVYGWREHGAVIRAGTSLAWQWMAPALGADSTFLSERGFWMQVYGQADRHHASGMLLGNLEAGAVSDGATSADVAHRLEEMVGSRIAREAHDGFSEWAGNTVPMTYDVSARSRAYLELVTAPSAVAHRCLAAELMACRMALELDSVADPVTTWYNATERALLVARSNTNYSPRTRERREACVDHHDDLSCVEVLRAAGRALPLPLSVIARESLVRTALSIGRDGAYGRLVRTKGPARDRLAAAAGVPIDSLISLWHAEVLAARPPTAAVPPATQWSTALWVLALAALALRSSRWRYA